MSAFVGQPPATEDDYWMVRWIIMSANGYGRVSPLRPDMDPALGVPGLPKAPPGYVFETRQPGVIIATSVLTVLMFLMTAVRLGLRWCRKDLAWGLDDWLVIPGAVSAFVLS